MVQEHYAYIVIYERQQPKRMFSYATYIMLIHALMCWLVGQRVILNQIQLKCDAPTDDIDYKVRFVKISSIKWLKTIFSSMPII